jgi:hypothetical protein
MKQRHNKNGLLYLARFLFFQLCEIIIRFSVHDVPPNERRDCIQEKLAEFDMLKARSDATMLLFVLGGIKDIFKRILGYLKRLPISILKCWIRFGDFLYTTNLTDNHLRSGYAISISTALCVDLILDQFPELSVYIRLGLLVTSLVAIIVHCYFIVKIAIKVRPRQQPAI